MKPIKPVWVAVTVLGLLALAFQWVSLLESRPFTSFHIPPLENEPENSPTAGQAPSNPLGNESQEPFDQEEFDEEAKKRDQITTNISTILYSDSPKEIIAEKLKLYVRLGNSMEEFNKKPGGLAGNYMGTTIKTTGLKSYEYHLFCGLAIGTDEYGNIISISRAKKTINNKEYPNLEIAP